MPSVANPLITMRRRAAAAKAKATRAKHTGSMKARIAAKAKATRHKHRVRRVARARAGHASAVLKVGTKAQVYKGLAHHTKSGLKKADIVRVQVGKRRDSKTGKVKGVYRYKSAKKHAAGKAGKTGNLRALRAWRLAVRQVTGGVIPRKGTTAYAEAKKLYLQIIKGGRVGASSLGKAVARRRRRVAARGRAKKPAGGSPKAAAAPRRRRVAARRS